MSGVEKGRLDCGGVVGRRDNRMTLYKDAQRTHENFVKRSKASVVYKVSE